MYEIYYIEFFSALFFLNNLFVILNDDLIASKISSPFEENAKYGNENNRMISINWKMKLFYDRMRFFIKSNTYSIRLKRSSSKSHKN